MSLPATTLADNSFLTRASSDSTPENLAFSTTRALPIPPISPHDSSPMEPTPPLI
jgi:hypothetical protein